MGRGPGDKDTPLLAYCVSTTHFVPIGHDLSTGVGQSAGSSRVVTADFNAAVHQRNGSRLAVEAVVTSINRKTSLFATSVVMQAQAYNGLWHPVADGYSYCTDCTSVGLAPFPETAQRVKVDVVMPEWVSTGLLWLASYPY